MKTEQHAYLIFFGSEEKNGQTDPQILEFESVAHRDAWLERGGQKYIDCIAETDGSLNGGWPTWHFISPDPERDNPDRLLDEIELDL